MRLGIDIMGGDFAPRETTLGALLALEELPADIQLVLVGRESDFLPLLKEKNADFSRIEIIHTPDVIDMGESPTRAIARKPESSISVGFKLLREGKIDAFASAGNTGAVLVGAMYSVKAIPGIIRPAIISVLPKLDGGEGILLDVGANSDCKPDVLYQFGMLGSLYAKHVCNIPDPKVALLNIGEEEEKGNLLSQAAFKLMQNTPDFTFAGNVEGRDLFNGKADVIVTDGFTGNVVLKEAESFYTIIKKKGIKDPYFDRFNYENYGGTPILGINGTVVIGHGISNAKAIKNMIVLMKDVHRAGLSERIRQLLP